MQYSSSARVFITQRASPKTVQSPGSSSANDFFRFVLQSVPCHGFPVKSEMPSQT